MEVEVFLVPPAEVDNLVQNAIGALAVDRPAVVEGNTLGRASICAENHDSRARREWSQPPRRGEGLQDRRSALELVASRSTDFPKDGYLEEVSRPGRYEFKSRTTVLEALSSAGGLTPFASSSRVVILRADGSTTQRIPFDYRRAINGKRSDGILNKIVNFGGGDQENFYLHPGDIILVP